MSDRPSRHKADTAMASDGGYVCDECGEPGGHKPDCPWGKPSDAASVREPMFPPGCKCPSYGRGLTMTRVNASYCPVHGTNPTLADKEEMRRGA